MKFSTKKRGSIFFPQKKPNLGGGVRGGFGKRPDFFRIFFWQPSLWNKYIIYGWISSSLHIFWINVTEEFVQTQGQLQAGERELGWSQQEFRIWARRSQGRPTPPTSRWCWRRATSWLCRCARESCLGRWGQGTCRRIPHPPERVVASVSLLVKRGTTILSFHRTCLSFGWTPPTKSQGPQTKRYSVKAFNFAMERADVYGLCMSAIQIWKIFIWRKK